MYKDLFAGGSILTKLIMRRDRIRLVIWIFGIAGFVAALVPVIKEFFAEGDEVRVMLEMMQNPAMIAIIGPVYGAEHYTTGAAHANMMLLFSVIIGAIMNIFLIARHTRQDEELGRLEIIRALPVGRLCNLASCLWTALCINGILGVTTGYALNCFREAGMDLGGCMLFGAGIGSVGMFFGALTAVFAQISSNNRKVMGFSFLSLFLFYILRAIGDVKIEELSLISPLGLVLRTKTFVENNWWPIVIILGMSIILSLVALLLAMRRDLGSGLIAEKEGKSHGGGLLSSPMGLSLKLMSTAIIIWMLVVFIFAAMYGSIFGDLDEFLANNALLMGIFAGTDFSLIDQFITLLVAVMSMIAAIPVISFMNRISSEERHGYAEQILTKSVSRGAQFFAYLIPTLAVSVVFQLLTALGFYVAGSAVSDEIPSLKQFVQASLAYLPAFFVIIGVAGMLIAFLPGKTSLSYLYLGYSFFAVYFGELIKLPEWMKKLTPFGHVSRYPVEEIKVLPLVIMTLLGVGLLAISSIGYRKRDMEFS
ncbi:ABC-2 type transport system permease protein [Aequitasia blattaphilus]|uniref:ABC transporter permease n=1 Tax=Aequitasia blattaphilus TaxID=2949332 RepID=A0ABT1EAL1_9FIRM|nr:ABC transporter permease [Aequitasia blattaphilus]MCP1102874.1 ABC transporter permease [Aequitasia blattaphilus]MCR8615514.1 ABC transporter permease [Aequitasia blattaphilus]